MLVEVEVAAQSDRGRVRPNNEDHYLVGRIGRSLECLHTNLPAGSMPERFQERGHVMLVADGLGGSSAGEVASALAVGLATRMAVCHGRWELKGERDHALGLVERMSAYLRDIDRILGERAAREPGLEGMATTLTIAYSVDDQLFLFHVGDSRAYLYRDGHLRQLTRDQTMAQELADGGVIAAGEVATHHLRHVLTNVVGRQRGMVSADVERFGLLDGDWLLLCSDGLGEHLDDAAVAGVLAASGAPADACRRLVAAALERGGRDNVTVIVGRYRIGPGATA
jgi:protein phosphatase